MAPELGDGWTSPVRECERTLRLACRSHSSVRTKQIAVRVPHNRSTATAQVVRDRKLASAARTLPAGGKTSPGLDIWQYKVYEVNILSTRRRERMLSLFSSSFMGNSLP